MTLTQNAGEYSDARTSSRTLAGRVLDGVRHVIWTNNQHRGPGGIQCPTYLRRHPWACTQGDEQDRALEIGTTMNERCRGSDVEDDIHTLTTCSNAIQTLGDTRRGDRWPYHEGSASYETPMRIAPTRPIYAQRQHSIHGCRWRRRRRNCRCDINGGTAKKKQATYQRY